MNPTLHAGAAMLLAGCSGPGSTAWQPRFPPLPDLGVELSSEDAFVGVRLLSWTQLEPRPLSHHLVLVDPLAPGVSFTGTPSNGSAPAETARETATEFAARTGVAVAVNAHFFSPWPAGPDEPADLMGLAVTDGEPVSPFQPGAAVGFAVSSSGEARVVRPADADENGFATIPALDIDDAVGASEQILTAGRNTATWEELHPRTAVGVTADGLVALYVVDGRQDGVSEGATTPEVADVLSRFGVVDAINLDGGGSTTLVARGAAGPELRNVPVGYLVPQTERHCGSFFGVRANAP